MLQTHGPVLVRLLSWKLNHPQRVRSTEKSIDRIHSPVNTDAEFNPPRKAMKNMPSRFLMCLLSFGAATALHANNFTLNPLTTFGGNLDGSIRPGDQVWVSAPNGVG